MAEQSDMKRGLEKPASQALSSVTHQYNRKWFRLLVNRKLFRLGCFLFLFVRLIRPSHPPQCFEAQSVLFFQRFVLMGDPAESLRNWIFEAAFHV